MTSQHPRFGPSKPLAGCRRTVEPFATDCVIPVFRLLTSPAGRPSGNSACLGLFAQRHHASDADALVAKSFAGRPMPVCTSVEDSAAALSSQRLARGPLRTHAGAARPRLRLQLFDQGCRRCGPDPFLTASSRRAAHLVEAIHRRPLNRRDVLATVSPGQRFRPASAREKRAVEGVLIPVASAVAFASWVLVRVVLVSLHFPSPLPHVEFAKTPVGNVFSSTEPRREPLPSRARNSSNMCQACQLLLKRCETR